MWGLSSPIRDQTCAPCIGSTESQPFDYYGSLQICHFFFFFFKQLRCSLGSHYLASCKASHAVFYSPTCAKAGCMLCWRSNYSSFIYACAKIMWDVFKSQAWHGPNCKGSWYMWSPRVLQRKELCAEQSIVSAIFFFFKPHLKISKWNSG